MAAKKAKPLKQRIIETCARYREESDGDGYITSDGIAQRISVKANKVSARVSELVRDGKLLKRERGGETFFRAV